MPLHSGQWEVCLVNEFSPPFPPEWTSGSAISYRWPTSERNQLRGFHPSIWGAPDTLLLLLLSRFSLSDSVWPHRQQPTRLRRPWDSPGKNTGVRCHFLLQCMKVKSESEVAQSCTTLNDPMDCSPPGSSVHGIFQARGLERGAIPWYTAHPNKLPEKDHAP